jgi:hypothetical protein
MGCLQRSSERLEFCKSTTDKTNRQNAGMWGITSECNCRVCGTLAPTISETTILQTLNFNPIPQINTPAATGYHGLQMADLRLGVFKSRNGITPVKSASYDESLSRTSIHQIF